jgi:hypothetical protein
LEDEDSSKGLTGLTDNGGVTSALAVCVLTIVTVSGAGKYESKRLHPATELMVISPTHAYCSRCLRIIRFTIRHGTWPFANIDFSRAKHDGYSVCVAPLAIEDGGRNVEQMI